MKMNHAQVSKDTLESITTPDKVETSIGTLNFIDGAPSPETAQKVYDYLDTMRGVDAFMKGMRGASLHAERDGPIVVEAPAGMLGAFNNAWFEYLEDIGPFGPDRGKGGKSRPASGS